MFRRICFALLLAALFLTAAPVSAEIFSLTRTSRYPSGEILTFVVTSDSATTDTSVAFNLGKYDHISWVTYPFRYRVQMISSPADSYAVMWYVDGSMDGTTWTIADTITADTLETTGTTLLNATTDFNNVKWPYYRLRIQDARIAGTATPDMTVTIKLWCYQDN